MCYASFAKRDGVFQLDGQTRVATTDIVGLPWYPNVKSKLTRQYSEALDERVRVLCRYGTAEERVSMQNNPMEPIFVRNNVSGEFPTMSVATSTSLRASAIDPGWEGVRVWTEPSVIWTVKSVRSLGTTVSNA
jgi:hypothetical protein